MRLIWSFLFIAFVFPAQAGAKCTPEMSEKDCAVMRLEARGISKPQINGGPDGKKYSGSFWRERWAVRRERIQANQTSGTPRTPLSNTKEDGEPKPSFFKSLFRFSPQSRDRVMDGMGAVLKGDVKTALTIGVDLQKEQPDNPIGYRLTAQALAGAGDSSAALKEVAEGLKYAPHDEGLNALSKLLSGTIKGTILPKKPLRSFKPKKSQGARAGYSQTRKPQRPLPPREDRLTPKLKDGMTLLSVGDHIKAVHHFTGVLNEDSDNALAFRLRALGYYELKKFKLALADTDAAITHAPNDARAHELRGLILSRTGRNGEARNSFTRAIKLAPHNASLYISRARFLKMAGDRNGELADLKKAATLESAYESLYRQTLGRYEAEEKAATKESRGFPWRFLAAVAGLLLVGMFVSRRKKNEPPATSTPTPTGADYEIIRKLGEGAMGEVYAVRDRRLDRVVAVKRMKPGISGDSNERARFLREARTVAALKHTGIVEIHQVVDDGNELYLVFELVSGGTLADRLKSGSLDLIETKTIVSQIAAALDYAHEKGVIHRDLKPANILLSEEGAKVTDFGVARRPGLTGEIIGTPGFMPPEQLHGSVTESIDIYALAVCAREMLGRPLPDSLDHATDPDPSKRFATAGDFARAFGDI